jgi:hypothetical protein
MVAPKDHFCSHCSAPPGAEGDLALVCHQSHTAVKWFKWQFLQMGYPVREQVAVDSTVLPLAILLVK